MTEIIDAIKHHHRQRRYAIKLQQKIDRALESYVRINYTDWDPQDEDKKRQAAENSKVKVIINAARKGEGADVDLIKLVQATDTSRSPMDGIRSKHTKMMETLAKELPVYPLVKSIPGAGNLGLAIIIAETGDLSKYASHEKVWKRLGFAPFDGYAGSTWKRETWRPRALTKEEWIDNPFSGQRYAQIHQIAVWLKTKQWIGKGKTDDGVGKPNGPFGELYAKRRARTAVTHPDWTKGHADMDALRVMVKEYIKLLWKEWHLVAKENARHFMRVEKPGAGCEHEGSDHLAPLTL